MAYMTAEEAAIKWNVPQRLVVALCSAGLVADVTMIDNMWYIPAKAAKPGEARLTEPASRQVKPFLKWVGGKTQLLPEIRKFYPFGSTVTKYAEPFVGGGAVLFDVLNNATVQEVYISDMNGDLINTYQVIKNDAGNLVSMLNEWQSEFLPLNQDERKEYFYIKRENFNKLKHAPSGSNSIIRAALMIYLNKTCFNGLYRVNRKGDYNVPMGAYKQPLICDKQNLLQLSRKLQNVQIVRADYKKVEEFADERTFIYFDPPYRPLTTTSNFTSYTEDEFDDNKQLELAQFIKKLSDRRCKVLASNSDPRNADENDDFFDIAYSGLNIHRVQASRMINSKGSSRGKISELLISNY
jgi:DNA adenine methylase